ncbi:MAG: energy-coupling factor ABC transporter ATP-binding protein [Desulfovibrio aminophilus]|uniref:energy-coupling factor ABC transporter ATP-binding protein n=1 Tax=Desulfovibrio aminophilus TaxID=81425 RepID=UPI0004147335|nr:ABC transporter ATP-binding protein [Desulfovibrio aminophilus]
MNDAEALIETRGLVCGYPGREPVLRGLDLTLRPGERRGLVGPNGSGKTTLLFALMGLIKPSEGEIRLFGRAMTGPKEFAAARLRLGFLFQHADDQLFSPSVLDDVAFGPLNQGLSRAEARRRAEETLELLGLSDFADRVPYRLSGGEQKLVALATVLSMRPEALILDEPTTGLDRETKARIVDILNGLDIAVLAVSHEPDFLSKITNRLYSLRDGRLVESTVEPHAHVHVHAEGGLPHSHDD